MEDDDSDLNIPWKRHRREKIAREHLPPQGGGAGDTSYRFRAMDPDKIVYLTPAPRPGTDEEQFREDDECMPL